MSRTRRALAAALALWPAVAAEAQQEPLSAIDWLSRSVAEPPEASPGPAPATPIAQPPITVVPLAATNLDAVGLLPPASTGLPADLWGTSPTQELARLLRAERIDTLPAIQGLLMTLLLAELDPPADSDGTGALFLARIDKLLDLGALDPALALLERTAPPRAEPFRRWFDIALLLGEEDAACGLMRDNPQIAPTFPARVFCLARGGDWTAAALSLSTGAALGRITPEMEELLARFLDPALAEGAEPLPRPRRPSPLVLRLMEAIGQPLQTATLPVAFAHADLRSNTGWKARIEAGERLARVGAIPANRLLGLYTEQRPAASGGVWDRVAAVQRLDTALTARDPVAVAAALPPAWAQMEAMELEVPFATLYGPALARMPLKGSAGSLAFRIGLLSEDFAEVAAARRPEDGTEAFLAGLAGGEVQGLAAPGQLGAAIRAAFAPFAQPGPEAAQRLAGGRIGEALLVAIEQVTEGAKGDLRDVTEGLVVLRRVGLEGTARRAALELLLLERRG
ncbi:MAG: hypothetical protein NXH83_00795 [Rhodobacteraceae bacterium]|nr:hypothetical protein [Paracoccaceae bacterium]